MKTTRREFIPFSFYDHTGMEKHLEKMARKGWMVEELSNLGWKYRAIEPQRLHFYVSFDTRASQFEPEPTEEQATFQEFCARSGWKLAAFSGQMQIFYNEEEDPLPIQTDPEMEIRMVGKLARRVVPLYIVFLVLGFLLGGGWCVSLVNTPIKALTTPGGVLMGLYGLCLFLYGAVDLIVYYTWRRRALAAAQRGEFLPTKGCHKLFYIVMAVMALGLVYWFAVENRPGMRFLAGGMLLAYVVIFLAMNGTKRTMKRRKASAGLNRGVTMGVDVILAMVLMGGVTWLFFQGVQHGVFFIAEQIEAPLSASDLIGVDEEKYLTTVSVDMTPFLDRREVRCRTGFDQEELLPGMEYTLVNVHVPWIYNACFRELCRDTVVQAASHTREMLTTVQYEPVDPTPWGAEEAYQFNLEGEFQQKYVLCWPEKIVQLEADWDLTAEQMAVVGEKLKSA